MVGASAAIMGVLIFLCSYVPHYKINLPFNIQLNLWILGSIIVGFDIIQLLKGNTGGNIAHLGGSLFGFVKAYQIKKGIQFSYKKKKKYNTTSNTSTKVDNKEKIHQQKIDRILDKIGKSGYESLSKQEKEYLFKVKK